MTIKGTAPGGVALDSQSYSYVVDTLEGYETPPAGALARQQLALVRLYLYTPGTLWLTPTVEREYERISDPVRRQKHKTWTVLFGVRHPEDEDAVERRVLELENLHDGRADCRVLAEAEAIEFSALLSYDLEFVRRLAAHARLRLVTAAGFWDELVIPRGTPPLKMPAPDNPLLAQDWWRW